MAGHICSAANFIIQSVHGAEHKHTNTQTDRLGNAAICVKFTNSQEEIARERGREREYFGGRCRGCSGEEYEGWAEGGATPNAFYCEFIKRAQGEH